MISEIYLPPRVTVELTRTEDRQCVPGFAVDLTTIDPKDGLHRGFNYKNI